MKIDFPLPTDDQRHVYCLSCHKEGVHEDDTEGIRLYKCDNCGKANERCINIDPLTVWWVDKETQEYWHESVGVFVLDFDKRILIFERTIYPLAFTIPAGHLEKEEEPQLAAIRELNEETGIKAESLIHFRDLMVVNDPCRRGADSHKWHVYLYKFGNEQEISIDSGEGKDPVWLTLSEALSRKLTPPVRYILENYGDEIINS